MTYLDFTYRHGNKIILTYEESGNLIPHWFELNQYKLQRIENSQTRVSKLIPEKKQTVLDTPAIIITPLGYIVNGKHRALISFQRQEKLEAIIIASINDIINHTPHNCYGEAGQEGCIKAFLGREMYVNLCKKRGIYTISDFISS